MTNTANDRPQEWYDARADHLAEFLTDERRRTLAAALAERTRYMTLLAENTFHPHNASALMRHCDAFGVQELHTVETLCKFSPNASIVRGTDKWVDVRRHASTAEAIAALRAEGYRIVATTPHRESCTPETFDVARGPFALVFGTEHAGISDEAMAAADEYLRIPMCGLVESLNVSASAAILVYMLSQRVRSTGGEYARVGQGSIRNIIFQPGQFVCASETERGSYNPQNIYNMRPTDIHYEIADWAIAGNRLNGLGTALWFFNPFSPSCRANFPSNVGTFVMRIGDHCFYNPTAAHYDT